MAITVLRKNARRAILGQNGYYQIDGIAQFSTTDASGTIPCELKKIQSWEFGALAADQGLSLDEAANLVNGMIAPQYGVVTVKRTGSDSGAKFSFAMRGIY